jgi:predicted nucleic acid-binding protein
MESIFADTNALIRLLGGDVLVAELTDGKTVFISEMTEMELLCKPNQTKEQKQIIAKVLADCIIVPFSPEIKRQAIKVRLTTRLKLIDAIIAATAMMLEMTILTNDEGFSSLKNMADVLLLPNYSKQ